MIPESKQTLILIPQQGPKHAREQKYCLYNQDGRNSYTKLVCSLVDSGRYGQIYSCPEIPQNKPLLGISALDSKSCFLPTIAVRPLREQGKGYITKEAVNWRVVKHYLPSWHWFRLRLSQLSWRPVQPEEPAHLDWASYSQLAARLSARRLRVDDIHVLDLSIQDKQELTYLVEYSTHENKKNGQGAYYYLRCNRVLRDPNSGQVIEPRLAVEHSQAHLVFE